MGLLNVIYGILSHTSPAETGQGVERLLFARSPNKGDIGQEPVPPFFASARQAYPTCDTGNEKSEQHQTKTQPVVAVVRMVVVAVRAATVLIIIVKRAAAKNPLHEPVPAKTHKAFVA